MEVKVGSCKNLFCRDQCWKLINNLYGKDVFINAPGAKKRTCTYADNCRGAHSEDEIHTLPHIHAFNCLDKSKLDLVKIYLNIKNVFESSKDKVINNDFKNRLNSYDKLNFVELMNLWFDITCYHRRIKKDMKSVPGFKSEFSSINNIPEFYLEDEDIVWGLERITKLCPKNRDLIAKIESNDSKPNIWDICLASTNCKLGCHNYSYLLCNDDLINGSCDCISKEEFEAEKESVINEILALEEQLKTNRKKKNTFKIQNSISSLTNQLNKLRRKVHFTEEGLIPFNIQLGEYEKEMIKIEKEEIKKVEDRSNKMNTVVKKKIVKPKI